MTTEEERLEGIDRSPQPWWSSNNQQRRIRERRIDSAVRLKLPTRQSLVYFERSATCDTAWAAFLAANIRAEYRRIVEREEGRA